MAWVFYFHDLDFGDSCAGAIEPSGLLQSVRVFVCTCCVSVSIHLCV